MSDERKKSDGSLFHLLALLALASAILFPRAIAISNAHSERIDDHYHLWRGLMFWNGRINEVNELNDPPLGEAISALPLLWTGCTPGPERQHVLYHQPLSPERLLLLIALWKSLLFLPV